MTDMKKINVPLGELEVHAILPRDLKRTRQSLGVMRDTELLAIVTWLKERVIEMKPDRSSIKEEYRCDLVGLLDGLGKDILWDINTFPARESAVQGKRKEQSKRKRKKRSS
jgi:hypothetical protein